jgi:Neuraminidase (sialidase)
MVRLSSSGALLAFSEARKGSGGDGDQIDVGFKRSTDSGRSWSALRSIVPNDQGPTTLGNNVALVVNRTTSNGGERVVLVFSVNNTKVWQIHSDDAGLRWSAPTDITSMVKLPNEGWIATGPANGIVLATGRLLVPVNTNVAKGSITIDFELVPGSLGRNRQCPMQSLRVGVRGAAPSPLPPLHAIDGSKAVVDPCEQLSLSALFKLQQRAYVMISDDQGDTWSRGEALPLVASETAIAQLADGSILARSRLGESGWQDNCAAFAISATGGETWVPMNATLVGDPGAGAKDCIPTPGVQNSMLARGRSVFLAGPRIYGTSDHPRGNITLYQSTDLGSTWRNIALLYEGSTAPGDGYSSMVNLADDAAAIGVVFSGGDEILFQSQVVA